MEVTILSSGSSGNATLIEHDNCSILLDCGVTYKNLKSKFSEIEKNINDLDYVFISHEHSDHVRGLEQIVKHLDVNVIMSKGTFDELNIKYKLDENKIKTIGHLEKLQIESISVGALSLSHDAREPMLYVFKHNTAKFWFFHDSGYMPQKYYKILKNPSLMVIESNYDVAMLLDSEKYPHYLKMRIHGDYGHLSNDQAFEYIQNLAGSNTKEIIVAHVSENNNDEKIITNMYQEFESENDIKVSISKQREMMKTRRL